MALKCDIAGPYLCLSGFIDIYRGIPLDKDHARCQRSVRNLTRDQKQISQMKKSLRFLSIRSPNPKFSATKITVRDVMKIFTHEHFTLF